jgi:hypothetical protein
MARKLVLRIKTNSSLMKAEDIGTKGVTKIFDLCYFEARNYFWEVDLYVNRGIPVHSWLHGLEPLVQK